MSMEAFACREGRGPPRSGLGAVPSARDAELSGEGTQCDPHYVHRRPPRAAPALMDHVFASVAWGVSLFSRLIAPVRAGLGQRPRERLAGLCVAVGAQGAPALRHGAACVQR